MGFKQITACDEGIILGIHEDGRLLYFRDLVRDGTNAPNGSSGWATGSGNQVGQGFDGIRQLAGGDDGILYAIHQDGRLLFFRDLLVDGSNAPNGSTGWAPGSGNQIGQGFDGIRHLVGGDDGVLYAIHEDGRLLYFRDLLRDGSNAPNGSTGWAPGSGSQIGQGFDGIEQMAGGDNGILYAIHQDGRLLYFRDLSRDGTNAPNGSTGWASGSGNQIGQGFDGIDQMAGGDNGILYAIHQDGRLLYFRDLLRDGSNAPNGSTGWAPGTGNQIGQGFN